MGSGRRVRWTAGERGDAANGDATGERGSHPVRQRNVAGESVGTLSSSNSTGEEETEARASR